MKWFESKILMSFLATVVFAAAVVTLEVMGQGSEAAYGVLGALSGIVLGRIAQPAVKP